MNYLWLTQCKVMKTENFNRNAIIQALKRRSFPSHWSRYGALREMHWEGKSRRRTWNLAHQRVCALLICSICYICDFILYTIAAPHLSLVLTPPPPLSFTINREFHFSHTRVRLFRFRSSGRSAHVHPPNPAKHLYGCGYFINCSVYTDVVTTSVRKTSWMGYIKDLQNSKLEFSGGNLIILVYKSHTFCSLVSVFS